MGIKNLASSFLKTLFFYLNLMIEKGHNCKEIYLQYYQKIVTLRWSKKEERLITKIIKL